MLNSNPKISVVVPVRDSARYISGLIESLITQTFPPYEIILVGNTEDNTWDAVQPYVDQGLVRTIGVTTPPNWGGRDSNYKRFIGCQIARGDIIALTDSKISLPFNWLVTATNLMQNYEVEAVAGVMRSLPTQKETLMVKVLDKGLICENPRFGKMRLLTKQTFGSKDSLPVTANFFFTRRVFEQICADFPVDFTVSYEDFSLAWVIARQNVTILCSDQLQVFHRHRDDLRSNILKHSRSGFSAAQLWKWDRHCPYGWRRAAQVGAIVLILLAAYLGLLVSIAAIGVISFLLGSVVGGLGLLGMGILNVVRTKDIAALLFPPVLTLLILVFCWHFIRGVVLIPPDGKLSTKMADSYLQIY